MKRSLLCLLVVCCACTVSAGSASGAPGAGLDRSYGSNGVADLSARADGSRTEAWAAAADGSVVVIRSRWECGAVSPCVRALAMQRYGPSGEFDQAFGAGTGAVTLAQDVTGAARPGLAVDAEGEVLATWSSANTTFLARYDQSGAPDLSFGAGGKVGYGCQCGEGEGVSGVVLLPGGKLLLRQTGRTPKGAGADTLMLWRLFPNGALDPSFGSGGGVTLGYRYGAAPTSFGVRPNGSVVLAGGPGCCESNRLPYVSRLSVRGRIVTGFTANAAHSLQALPEAASMTSLVARPNGKVDLLGSSGRGGFVFRLLASGRRDRAFGKRGLERLAWPVSAAARDAAGGIFTASEDPVRDALVAHRLLANSRADRRFGGGFGVPALGVPIYNALETTVLRSGRALVFAGGYPECRYGGCEQQPRLVMFQEPPLGKRR